jgi:TorA maturation chaperone TorD/DNA-binding transcriptional regulator YdaS (Cro superfamily)
MVIESPGKGASAGTRTQGMARDSGLNQAIEAAGGVGALARALGIAQPSVSSWTRVPSDRVVAVEAATGVSRSALRPDLYGGLGDAVAVDPVDRARAEEYALLSHLLMSPPSAETLGQLARLRGDATAIGMAHLELAAAADADVSAVQSEYFALFIGLGRGELLPYGSYYLTGFLHERPLARVREDLQALGIERSENISEPEDHIGMLFEIMSGLALRRFGGDEAAERRFFERHLKPWAARFFSDLESAKSAKFYRAVGQLGRAFMEIEAEAFSLAA